MFLVLTVNIYESEKSKKSSKIFLECVQLSYNTSKGRPLVVQQRLSRAELAGVGGVRLSRESKP